MVKNSKSLRRNTKRRGNKVNKSRRRNTRTRMKKRTKGINNKKRLSRKKLSKRKLMKGGIIGVRPGGDFFDRPGSIFEDGENLIIQYTSGWRRDRGNEKKYKIIARDESSETDEWYLLLTEGYNDNAGLGNRRLIYIRSSGLDDLTKSSLDHLPLLYASVNSSNPSGDIVDLLLFNADTPPTAGSTSNPNPILTVQQGSIMRDMWTESVKKQMFVLPSQLNGAEYIDIDQIPNYHQGWLSMYVKDRTGGPIGQLAGDHNIAEFIVNKSYNDFNTGPDTINYVRQICNDDTLRQKISLKNGYLQINGVLDEGEMRILEDKMNTIQLLVSKDIPVSGYKVNDQSVTDMRTARAHQPEYIDGVYSGKKVHLAYASAIPIGDKHGYPYGNPVSETVTQVANIIMKAQYIAALKAAKHLGVNELFLMPLGGGVFNNQQRDILSNILIALKAVDMSGIDVKLLTYEDEETDDFTTLLTEILSAEN